MKCVRSPGPGTLKCTMFNLPTDERPYPYDLTVVVPSAGLGSTKPINHAFGVSSNNAGVISINSQGRGSELYQAANMQSILYAMGCTPVP